MEASNAFDTPMSSSLKLDKDEKSKDVDIKRYRANQDAKCLSATSETSWLWHRRLGHMHMEHLKDISSKELVRGLPKIKFEKDKEFEISMMGELTFFLGLQIKQSKDGIFINQAIYTKELLKGFDMEASNAFDTPISSSLKLDKDEKGKDVDIKRYKDEADWGVGVGELEGAVVVGEGVAVGVGDGDVLEEGEVHDAVGDGEGRELDDVDDDLRVFRFEEEEVINDDDSGSQEEQEDRGHYARGKVGCTAGLRSVRLGREMFDRPGGKAGGRRRGRCRTGRACPGGAGGQAGGRRSGSRRRCSRRQAPAPCIDTASLQNEDEADRGHYARVFVEIHIVIQKRGVDFTVPAGKNPIQRQIEAGHTMEKG
ncbi:hypothetical protein RJ640_006280 [Escallonia rubra]|uniref:GAG-pre-integrase domain-containing protein n=1 Tax=Escallonia rubra TaxID=112253 RepID=A0AA88R8L5_9ASTE|nr:hypothetical protein RJ640_006280 [Escallonia rubra]